MLLMSALIYFWHKQDYNFYNVRPRSNEVTYVDFTHLITKIIHFWVIPITSLLTGETKSIIRKPAARQDTAVYS